MNSNPQNVICLYSKFSNSSKEFVDSSNNLPINFVCIDNKEVRNRVISDSKLKITFVPCILSVFSDGRLEKFEGVDAFKWLENVKLQATQQPAQTTQQPAQTTQQPAQTTQQQPVQTTQQQPAQTTQQPSEKNNEFSQHDFHSQQMRDKHSKITELDFEQETEGEPQVSSGMKNSLNDKENLMIKSINKISTKNSGKKDVMAAAREMEKMREQEESQKPRPPNMPKI
jgi:hypothetical protein